MSAAIDILKDNFNEALKYLIESSRTQLAIQGHRNTGKLDASFEAKIQADLNAAVVTGTIYMEDYGFDVNRHRNPDELGQFHTHYLKIVSWLMTKRPDLNASEMRSFAYLTSKRHFDEGVSTEASKRFSQNGKRTGWMEDSIYNQDEQETAFEILNLAAYFEALIDDFLTGYTKAA